MSSIIFFNWYQNYNLKIAHDHSISKMGSKQFTFKEGASLNRPPLFEGEHFLFWKKRMEIFIQSIDLDAWNAIIKCPFIPIKKVKVNWYLKNGMR